MSLKYTKRIYECRNKNCLMSRVGETITIETDEVKKHKEYGMCPVCKKPMTLIEEKNDVK